MSYQDDLLRAFALLKGEMHKCLGGGDIIFAKMIKFLYSSIQCALRLKVVAVFVSFWFLSLFGLNSSFASEVFSTDLCIHKFNRMHKYSYCPEVKKVHINVVMDDFYHAEGSGYGSTIFRIKLCANFI